MRESAMAEHAVVGNTGEEPKRVDVWEIGAEDRKHEQPRRCDTGAGSKSQPDWHGWMREDRGHYWISGRLTAYEFSGNARGPQCRPKEGCYDVRREGVLSVNTRVLSAATRG